MLSGIIFISAMGGGSDEIKHLNCGWQVLEISSRYPSNPFNPINQLYIKCTFYSITQLPSLAESNKAFLALIS